MHSQGDRGNEKFFNHGVHEGTEKSYSMEILRASVFSVVHSESFIYRTILLIPSFNTGTLKFMSKPTRHRVSRKYVSNCAS